MDLRVALRAGLLQLAGVIILAVPLGLILGEHFFRTNGWWAGPGAWLACAAAVAAILKLPISPVLIGAVVAGLPSALATALGLHWEGALLAIILFALWCGKLATDRGLVEEVI
jgi:hypothetical protein